ncbi:hypothetical protein KZZ52_15835 [Dactylosporangium sp. AC04546]|uniref:hypothetical protein n=1 Tax=Dactylosporangium sp. AC04546 TaxID=2862460 RepID=UPI001EE12CFD|nr:hypothetical protein [Dactylosporangium sp. AC04546]WVK86773.1 hypothetical protein KZZ52_15835 [Dactylosporangium sp. AC04546]
MPERPSIAVLTGAVHFAYGASTFASWRAPFTCGVEVSKRFQSGVDSTARLLNEGGRASVRRFDTFVRIRQQVTSSDLVTKRYRPMRAKDLTVRLKLLSCPRPDVTYPDEPDVTEVATINVDVSDSMHLPLAQRGIEVTMRFEQSQIHVTARTTFNGQQQVVNIVWRPTW